ncbi:hypothetical protein HF086_014059 [Spodoptera exigua]|uniref:Uncharacterized protein n=1 Tax=Spodoptera exigua TaxID=7107 RepID=A0A922MMK2_SPOEX|nr:hypothetical protein HF086_014059 [Spodoptera exigua]
MYGILNYYTLGFLFYTFVCCNSQNTTKPVIQISFFEYGAHIEGEELSFAVNGFIPPFIPIFTQNVTVSELKRLFW